MDFRHIDAFRALMQTRTTTKAAQLLGTSQSGISRLIADLERSTRLTLFDRGRGRLEPTEEAFALYGEVERRYAGLESIREYALGLSNPSRAVIRVGSVVSFGIGYFACVLAKFRQTHPTVHISLSIGASDLILDQVATHQLSLGLVGSTVDVAAATETVLFSRMDAICALPAGHPLASKRVIKAADLKGYPLLSYEPSDMVRWGMDRVIDDGGLQHQVVATARYSVNIAAMVNENVGIGLLHPVAAYDFLQSGLVLRRFKPSIPFDTFKVQPKATPPSVALDALALAMDEALAEVTAAVEQRLAR